MKPIELSEHRLIVRLGSGLLVANVLCVLVILLVLLFPSNIFRILLSIPFLIFCPGYAFMAALYIKKEGMTSIARVALSFLLSMVVLAIIGYVLNFTVWGIRLEPILYSILSLILILSIIAFWRRRGKSESENFQVNLELRMPGWGQTTSEKIFAIILVIVLLGAIGIIGHTLSITRPEETFTEFYILGQEGRVDNYPIELSPGEANSVIVGIINHEGEETSYRVRAVIDDITISEFGPITLENGEKSESELSFTINIIGDNQKLEFILYKGDDIHPYIQPAYLWINVR